MRRLIDSPWLYFGLAALLVLYAASTMFELRLPTRPTGSVDDIAKLRDRDDTNIVFILVDTLRADRLGTYGYERDTTPILDMLAAGGVRFDNVRAHSSWTKTSMASLWTAANPASHGVHRFAHALSDDEVLPAEILQKAGFQTVGLYRNGWVGPNFGFAQGFDTYLSPRSERNQDAYKRGSKTSQALDGTDLDASQAAVEFIKGNSHNRFMLYLHYMDVHQYLYEADSGLFGTSYSDSYDNAIHWTDRNISQVIVALEEAGVMDKTIVVVASDHGEAFREHGNEGHAKDLHTEVVHVPLLMFLPFWLEEQVQVPDLVRNIDIWPTLLDLVGLEPPPNADGISLVPLIEAAARGEDTAPHAPGDAMASLDLTWGRVGTDPKPLVTNTEWPYRVHVTDPDAEDPRILLYDVDADPGEQRNLNEDEATRSAMLLASTREKLETQAKKAGAVEVEIDQLRLNQLRALGYAVETPLQVPVEDIEADKP